MNKLLLLTAFAAAATVDGQNFFQTGISAQTAARAGIYAPAADNAQDALAQNPAGLSYLTGPVVNLSILGTTARGDFSNAANQNSPMRFTGGVMPYGAAGIPIGTRWSIAAGFLPDLLSAAKWQFADAMYGPQHEKSAILAFRSTAGVSYRLTDRIAVGVSESAIYNANTLVMPYVFQSNPSLKGLKTLLDLHTTGIGYNTSAGITAKLSTRWTLSASYRSESSITSTGQATGNMGAQFAALQIPFQPGFAYRAQVSVELPRSAQITAAWQTNARTRIDLESGWNNWRGSFATLPVSLTNGTNPDINGLLQSNTIKDSIPLAWKDQYSFRAAVERKVAENWCLAGGYVHQNNPVPSSTLSPLTAAIMGNTVTAGLGRTTRRARFDIAYQRSLTAQQNVATSALLAGDFSQSQVRIGTQALILSASFHR